MICDERDAPFLEIGTEVSAKFKGAFCEAKIKNCCKNVKIKVLLKGGTTITVDDSGIRGAIRLAGVVEVFRPHSKQYEEGTIQMIRDMSSYIVVFNDGDEKQLRRSQLRNANGGMVQGVKTGFALREGERIQERKLGKTLNLDAMPLTNPEEFGSPVLKKHKTSDLMDTGESEEDGGGTDSETNAAASSKSIAAESVNVDAVIGQVICVYEDRERKKWFPAVVVQPRERTGVIKLKPKKEYYVRSFKDGRDFIVQKKHTAMLNCDLLRRAELPAPSIRPAVEKALAYLEKDDLPVHWDRDVLFKELSDSSESAESVEGSSDDEDPEEKDPFVAQLYKFMDERGTPINKAPMVAGQDLDLYRLYNVVKKLGGYNKVCNSSSWRNVLQRMKITNASVSAAQIKNAYNKYLCNFETFYKKLGFMLDDFSRYGRRPPAAVRGTHQSRSFERMRSVEKTSSEKPTTSAKGDKSPSAADSSGDKDPTSDEAVATKDEIKKKLASPMYMMRKAIASKCQPQTSQQESLSRSMSPEDAASDSGTESARSCSTTRTQSPRAEQAKKASIWGNADDWQSVEQDSVFEVGQRVHIKYHGKHATKMIAHHRTYEGKIVRIEASKINDSRRYLVHYRGWNARFDEFLPADRLSVIDSHSLESRKSADCSQKDASGLPVRSTVSSPSTTRARHTSSGSSCSGLLRAAERHARSKQRRRRSTLSSEHGEDACLITDDRNSPDGGTSRAAGASLFPGPTATGGGHASSVPASPSKSPSVHASSSSIVTRARRSRRNSSLVTAGLGSKEFPPGPASSTTSIFEDTDNSEAESLNQSSRPPSVTSSCSTQSHSPADFEEIGAGDAPSSRPLRLEIASTSTSGLNQLLQSPGKNRLLASISQHKSKLSLKETEKPLADDITKSSSNQSFVEPVKTRLFKKGLHAARKADFSKNSELLQPSRSEKSERVRTEKLSSPRATASSDAKMSPGSSAARERSVEKNKPKSTAKSLLVKTAASANKPLTTKRKRKRAACPFPAARRPNRTPKHQPDYSENEDVQSPSKREGGGSGSPSYGPSIASLKARVQAMIDQDPNYTSRFHFDEIDPSLKGEALISALQHAMGQVKEEYQRVKAKLLSVERRRKKSIEKKKRQLRRREREKEKERERSKEVAASSENAAEMEEDINMENYATASSLFSGAANLLTLTEAKPIQLSTVDDNEVSN